MRCLDGRIVEGPVKTVQQALHNGLVPLLYGDVVLDDMRGGTIASTEEIFEWLVPQLQPSRLVLAGEVDGIYTADPQLDPTATRISDVTPATLPAIQVGLGVSHGVDVTGGMVAKVAQAISMVRQQPGLEVIICSGLVAGNIQAALHGLKQSSNSKVGTRVYGD